MKISVTICIFLITFVSQNWCYFLKVKPNLPHGTKIFDFAAHKSVESTVEYFIAAESSHYRQCCSIDKKLGSLHYVSNKYWILPNKKNYESYQFSVIIKHLNYKIVVPVQVNVTRQISLPLERALLNPNRKHNALHWHSIAVYASHRTIGKLHHLLTVKSCPNWLQPISLCSCNVTTTFSNVFPSNQLILNQTIKRCDANQGYSILPTQDITFVVGFNSSIRISRRKIRIRRSGSGLHFQNPSYTTHIFENKPVNSLVTTIQAYRGNNVAKNVAYGLEPMENILSLQKFRIDNDGNIYTTAVLDREEMQKHVFRITADHARTVLNIIVDDVNDKKPTFVQQDGFQINIEENLPVQSVVSRIAAYDTDEGKNGEIAYSITKSRPKYGEKVFGILSNGDLVTTDTVNREKYPQYILTVLARDQGSPPLSNTIDITVNIEDKNDNWPQFTKSRYVVNINESVGIGHVIGKVSAQDSDAGNNGMVTYSIIQGNRLKKFAIDSSTGEISVRKKLDYEEAYVSSQAKYTLIIRASDNGRPPLSNTTGVMEINILDANDNTPRFYNSLYNFNVLESASINSVIGQVEAFDQDHGQNARISYSIVDRLRQQDLQVFKIEVGSGIIRVAKKLDYETKKQYQFAVRATDHGHVQRFAQADVTVSIQNVNDNAPRFDQLRYEKRIGEDTNVGTTILTVHAQDPDGMASGGLTYQIISGDRLQKFRIASRSDSGVIVLKKYLDYNEKRLYELVVRVSDGVLSNKTIVVISITDTNSHQPLFDSPSYTASLDEDVPIGSFVEQVHANDDDVGENARITYCFTNIERYVD